MKKKKKGEWEEWVKQVCGIERKKRCPSVSWTHLDVIEEANSKGIEMSEKEAESLLEEIGDSLVENMLSVGWHVIGEAIDKRYKNARD